MQQRAHSSPATHDGIDRAYGAATGLSSFRHVALRDLVIVLVAAGAAVVNRRLSGIPFTAVASLAVAAAGFVLHEWGHLSFALGSGARVSAPRTIWTVFLFHFDGARNTRRQFFMMSLGGYVATVTIASALLAAAAADWQRPSGLAALLLAVIALSTTALEIPTTLRVLRGGRLPSTGLFAVADDRATSARARESREPPTTPR